MKPGRLPRSSPYWPVVTHPQLRRVLPGLVVSALGDGMSIVAVSWLALQIAPAAQRGIWVAVAVAAYSLPGAAGGALLGRFMSGRGGAQLAGWNASLRAVSLAAIVVLYAVGRLDAAGYVALLAVSSLLSAWGAAGRYTLIAELLPDRHRLPANAVMTTIGEFATVVGPPLAGVLIGWSNAVVVIGVDAVSFMVLAVTYRLALPAPARRAEAPQEPRAGGFGMIRRDPALLGLVGLSFGFFFLFGPFYAAMPIHVAEDLHAPATLLGVYYTAFGIGAVVGGLVTGYLRRWPLWPTTVGVVVAFGAAMLPLGLGAPTGIALASFALAGAIWAPYLATSMALFQRRTPADRLAPVLAANGSVLAVALPLGTIVGAPLVTAIGARETLLACAVATVALGAIAAGSVGQAQAVPREPVAGEDDDRPHGEGGDERADGQQDDPGPDPVSRRPRVFDPVQREGGDGGVREGERPESEREGQPPVQPDQPHLHEGGEQRVAGEGEGHGVDPAVRDGQVRQAGERGRGRLDRQGRT
jgi:predicted MFS family arabinose efflux permease